jgi:hypothetical protein
MPSGRLVENAEYDALAEEHRDDADAQIELVAREAEADPTVLRLAFLGDIQIRHDLEAAGDRVAESVDRCWHARLAQDAVDAIANVEEVLVGLDVDVGCPLANGFEEQVVHQLDDAGFLGGVEFLRLAIGDAEFRGLVRGQLVERVAGHAVVGPDELANVALVSEHQLDRHPGEQPELVEGGQFERVAGRDTERAVLAADRDALLLEDQLRG